MPIIDNGITIAREEISDPQKSPTERFDEKGLHASRVWHCAWADRLTLATEMIRRYTHTTGARSFVYGDAYPHAPNCFLISIASIEPFGILGASGGNLIWEKARLTCEYGPLAFDPTGGGASSSSESEPDVVYEEDVETSAEFLTLPNKKLYWDSAKTDPIEDAEAPGRLVRMSEWMVKYKILLEEGESIDATVETFKGSVNVAAITSRSTGTEYGAETLLYQGAGISVQHLLDGGRLVDVAMKFSHRPGGWNKFYRSGNATPQAIYEAEAGGAASLFKPYLPLNDFTQLYV